MSTRPADVHAPRSQPDVAAPASEARTLAGLLRARGRLTAREIAPIARDVLAALADVHAAGLAHGDLSPTRISLSVTPAGPRARLCDRAGVPVNLDETPPSGGPSYRAPELAGGGAATVHSDLYAVGAILFAAVTGWLPGGQNAAPPPSALPLDPGFARIVRRALGRDVDSRYPSAVAMSEALGDWQATVDHVDGLLVAFLTGEEREQTRPTTV